MGGRSPEEWQDAITPEWREKIVRYREKFGPLNSMYRTDLAIARAVAPFLKKTKPKDLMIWPIDEPQEADVTDVFAMLKSVSTPRKD